MRSFSTRSRSVRSPGARGPDGGGVGYAGGTVGASCGLWPLPLVRIRPCRRAPLRAPSTNAHAGFLACAGARRSGPSGHHCRCLPLSHLWQLGVLGLPWRGSWAASSVVAALLGWAHWGSWRPRRGHSVGPLTPRTGPPCGPHGVETPAYGDRTTFALPPSSGSKRAPGWCCSTRPPGSSLALPRASPQDPWAAVLTWPRFFTVRSRLKLARLRSARCLPGRRDLGRVAEAIVGVRGPHR